jgi:hypothetical protein
MSAEVAGNNAEFSTVGQISVVTRSGTNQVHGSAFEVYTPPGWNAYDAFGFQSNSGTLQHQPGGSLGGPVFIPKIYDGRNRTFFFMSIEFERFGSPDVVQWSPTVPVPAWRSGDFSGLLPETVVKDPFGGDAPFPRNVIPTARLNPVSVAVQNRFYPLPNYGNVDVFHAGNYRAAQPYSKQIDPTGTLRIDHKFSAIAWLYGRMTRTYWILDAPSGNLPTYGTQSQKRYSNVYGLGYTQMITPTLVSETRYGFSSDHLPLYGPINGNEQVKALGLTGLVAGLPNLTGTYAVNWSGLGLASIGAGYQCYPCNYDPVHNGQETLSWFHGLHSVKAGFQIRRNDYETYTTPGNLFGNNTFSNRFTGYPYADFLLGIPTTAARAYPPLKQSLMEYAYAAFIQEEFRIMPKVTLSYGLRYEYKSPWREANGYESVFDPKTAKIVVPDSSLSKVSPLMPTGYIGVVSASQAGYPESLINGYKKGFAPRVGVAWRPLGNNTVFRGGFGLYYDNYIEQPPTAGVPFVLNEPAYTNPFPNPAVVLPNVFPLGVSAGPVTVSIPNAFNPNVRVPYVIQYNATLERQFGNTAISLSFVSTGARQVVYSQDINQPVASTALYINKPRPYPNYPGISYLSNGAQRQWRAGTIFIRRSLTNGLWFQSYYTLARDVGNLNSGGSAEDVYNLRRERGPMQNQPTHRVFGTMVYALPVGKGKHFLSGAGRLLDAVVGGWQISNNFVRETGFFVSPTWTGPDPTGTRYTTSSTPPNVTIRPNILFNPNLSNRTRARFFDVTAFTAPSPGAFGTSARGMIIGPNLMVLSSAVQKFFIIHERVKLRAEFMASNVTNHPNFSIPDTNITNLGTVGVLTAATPGRADNGPPRNVQLILRLLW